VDGELGCQAGDGERARGGVEAAMTQARADHSLAIDPTRKRERRQDARSTRKQSTGRDSPKGGMRTGQPEDKAGPGHAGAYKERCGGLGNGDWWRRRDLVLPCLKGLSRSWMT
jgi:hypothetical protein